MLSYVEVDEPERKVLLMGNEAVARGALEAGVHFCSGYPGNPASEIWILFLQYQKISIFMLSGP